MGLINWTQDDRIDILSHASKELSKEGFEVKELFAQPVKQLVVYNDFHGEDGEYVVIIELPKDLKKSDNPRVPLQLDVFNVYLFGEDGDWFVDDVSAEGVYLSKLPEVVKDFFTEAVKVEEEVTEMSSNVEISGKKVYKVQIGNSSSFLTLSEEGLIDHYRKEVENVNKEAGWDYTQWMVRPKTVKQALKTAKELGDTVTEVEYNPEDISYTEISAEEPYEVKVKFYIEDCADPVLAVFPEEYEGDGYVTCYAHLGQHGTCSLDYVEDLPEATYDEYKDLLEELKMIGYDPIVLNESKCETSDNKQAVINDIKKFLEENISNDGSTAYMELSPVNGREYLVLLDWVEGFEPNEDNFIDADGYGLEASIRWDENQYFKSDNPYPYYESGEVILGHHIGGKEDIEWVAEELYDDYIEASKIESEVE